MNAKSRFWWVLLPITVVTGVLSCALYFDWFWLLYSGFGWDWHYTTVSAESWLRLIPFALALGLYCVVGFWIHRRQSSWLIVWSICMGAVVTTSALATYGNPIEQLIERTVSENASGAFRVSMAFDSAIAGVRQWPALVNQPALATIRHMRLSPPGLPALYAWLGERLGEDSGFVTFSADLVRSDFCDQPAILGASNAQLATIWLGILSPLWLSLTVIPLYDIVRQLGKSRQTAGLVVMLWAFVPSVNAFVATHNTILPLLTTLSVAAFVRGQHGKSRTQFVLANIIAGLLCFATFTLTISTVPLLLLYGLLALGFVARQHTPLSLEFWRTAIVTGFVFGMGLLLGIVLWYWLAGYHLWTLLPDIMALHMDLERAYRVWILLHAREILIFFGVPFTLLWLVDAVQRPLGRSGVIGRMTLITLLILLISGTAQGEVARVWMFFMPLMLIPIGLLLAQQTAYQRGVFFALQAVWLFVMTLTLRPTLTYQPLPKPYAAVQLPDQLTTPPVPVDARFGDVLTLNWQQSTFVQDDNQLVLRLGWNRPMAVTDSFLFSILAIDPTGKMIETTTWLPFDYQYPTSCWHRADEDVVVDEIRLDLPSDIVAGEWWVSLSAFTYDDETGSPSYLPVTTARGVDPQQIGIGPIAVKE